MTNVIETNERHEPRGPRLGWWAAVTAIIAAAFAAGLFLKEPAERWLHRGHDHAQAGGGGAAEQLWTCSMHPQVIRDGPGICPICHMALEPMSLVKSGGSTMGSSPAGAGPEVVVDPVMVQQMGVRVAEVVERPLRTVVRATGSMQEPEPAHRDINLRVSGWIEKLYADTDGMPVEEGQPLFDLYSPEVQVAVEELIAARRSRDRAGADELTRRTNDVLYDAARRKLELWGLTERQVDELAALDKAPPSVAILSPMTGHLTEKMVYEGAAVKAGERAMRLADRSTMWLDLRVFEQDMAAVQPGQKVTATVAAAPGRLFEGEVMFIHPHLDPATRTALVRVKLPNPDHTLRQGMYATARIEAELAPKALLVPREAVIDTGERQIAFVAKDGGRFEPRRLELGAGGVDGTVQVLSGLSPGERVVTSGQFLLDSESRLKEAIQKHLDEQLLAKAGGAKRPVGATPSAAARQEPRPPARPVEMTAERKAEVDALVSRYLEVSRVLGAKQDPPKVVDAAALVEAAEALDDKAVVDAAEAFANADDPKQQRALFKPLSEAVIALVQQAPPSPAVADTLFVMHCPMVDNDRGAHWLQREPDVANPYYAKSMKACGAVEKTIEVAP